MKARAALEDTGWCVQVFWGKGEHYYQRLYLGGDIGGRDEEFARLVENVLNAYAESQEPPEDAMKAEAYRDGDEWCVMEDSVVTSSIGSKDGAKEIAERHVAALNAYAESQEPPEPDAEFEPDYAVPPGETVQEVFAHRYVEDAFIPEARRHLHRILTGEDEITGKDAALLSGLTGSSSKFWLNLEANYQAALKRLGKTRPGVTPGKE